MQGLYQTFSETDGLDNQYFIDLCVNSSDPDIILAALLNSFDQSAIDGSLSIDRTSEAVQTTKLAVENLFNVRIFGGFDGSHIRSVDHSNKSNKTDDIEADDFTNLIVSADFGMGLDIFIFYVDLGYQLGLTPVYTGGDQAKANAFYSNIGLRLSF